MRSGLAALSGDREAQEIVAFACLRSLIRGLWMSLGVIASLQLLGLGVEGHTASLFPGSPALDETHRWALAVTAPAEPPQRLTLTPVVLNQGLNTFFLVAGKDKREILKALRAEPDSGPSKYPAARIRPARGVVWYMDEAAAG